MFYWTFVIIGFKIDEQNGKNKIQVSTSILQQYQQRRIHRQLACIQLLQLPMLHVQHHSTTLNNKLQVLHQEIHRQQALIHLSHHFMRHHFMQMLENLLDIYTFDIHIYIYILCRHFAYVCTFSFSFSFFVFFCSASIFFLLFGIQLIHWSYLTNIKKYRQKKPMMSVMFDKNLWKQRRHRLTFASMPNSTSLVL